MHKTYGNHLLMIMIKNNKNQTHKASILAVSLIIMGVMIVISLGIATSAIQSRKSSIGSSKSSVAFQNADSGVEIVMQKIKDNADPADTISDVDPLSDSDGCNGIVNSANKYRVELRKADGTAIVCSDLVSDIDTIKSIGYSSQDTRAIQASVIQAVTSNIIVHARGTVGDERIELSVNGSLIDTFTLSTSYQDFTASIATSPSDTIRIEFINDNGSRDVRVDYIEVDGTRYQAEDQAVNTGAWNSGTGSCGGISSEWLHCDGYIEFPIGGSSSIFYQDSGAQGIVSIEAENYNTISSGANGDSWVADSTAGYSGTGARIATPDNGTNQGSSYAANSPEMEYEIDFVRTGTHYIWVRGLAADGNSDSVHAGLDGNESSSSAAITSFSYSGWSWGRMRYLDGQPARITVSSTGVHTLNIWEREDGFIIDKIVLTTSSSYTPSGTGPAETK